MANKKILTDLSVDGDITGDSFIKVSGASTEFLKADGSVDTNTYITSASLPSGNQIIDWTTDQGATNIHANNIIGYLPLSGGGNLSGGVININTNTNTNTLNISRGGNNSREVMKIGVTDRVATFNYIEDTTNEGNGNFGEYQFKLGGNDGESTVTALTIAETGVTAKNFTGSTQNTTIQNTSSDGSDTGALKLAGGGAASGSRGAVVQLFGNEHATNPGNLYLAAGGSGIIDVRDDTTFVGKITGQDSDSIQLDLRRGSSGTNGNTSISFTQPLGTGYVGLDASGAFSFGTAADLATSKFKVTRSGNGTFSGDLTANNLSGTNTGDQDLSGYALGDLDDYLLNTWTVILLQDRTLTVLQRNRCYYF